MPLFSESLASHPFPVRREGAESEGRVGGVEGGGRRWRVDGAMLNSRLDELYIVGLL